MDLSKKNNILNLLNLNKFKIRKCNNNIKHNIIFCCYYHGKEDKRRNLINIQYKNILCKNYNKCLKGDKCWFSHNKIEMIYHPDFYKKKYCKIFLKNGKCKYKIFCCFAHSENELRIKLIHKLKKDHQFFLFFYKTEFCPLGLIKHDYNLCVYCHNFKDYRRKNLLNLLPNFCNFWNSKKSYLNYNEECKMGHFCNYLHGWNEKFYHPSYYKQKICKYKFEECKKKFACNKIHENEKKITKFDTFIIPSTRKLY